jgi:hypothetical protein
MPVSDEDDYSDYINHLSNSMNFASLTSGFLFTTYTLLITFLPNPSAIISQLTLLIISLYLDALTYLLTSFNEAGFSSCKSVPKTRSSKEIRITNLVFFLVASTGEGVAVIMMSLLWNLVLLAVVQAVLEIFVLVVSYQVVWRRFWRLRESKL